MKLFKFAPVLLAAIVLALSGCSSDILTTAGVSKEAAPAPGVSVQETVIVPNTNSADEAVAEVNYITASNAESAALTHAGVSEYSTLSLRSEFNCDDKVPNYDVDFCYEGTEYDYEINAKTGEVIKVEKEKCDHRHSSQTENADEEMTETKSSAKTESTDASSSKISRSEAKAIALKHAGLSESSVKHLEIEYDKDNGVFVYEVSFEHNGYEYDYDINSKTGKIISYDKERDD